MERISSNRGLSSLDVLVAFVTITVDPHAYVIVPVIVDGTRSHHITVNNGCQIEYLLGKRLETIIKQNLALKNSAYRV
jgi:hypothetical protein